MESIMNFVPHNPYQMDNMIMWIEDELRYF